jgi:hypothetical protein
VVVVLIYVLSEMHALMTLGGIQFYPENISFQVKFETPL